MMDNNFDIVIIDVGIAGLGCASLLASGGFRVAFFERIPYIGGLAAIMSFRGFTINTGLAILVAGDY
jgi:phytoene dehydrogenase-like protein